MVVTQSGLCKCRGIRPGECEAFFDELDIDTPASERPDYLSQVIKVACQAVHAMDDYNITFSDKFH